MVLLNLHLAPNVNNVDYKDRTSGCVSTAKDAKGPLRYLIKSITILNTMSFSVGDLKAHLSTLKKCQILDERTIKAVC